MDLVSARERANLGRHWADRVDPDTSCILAWLIEQGYEVYTFMADVGQEEVRDIWNTCAFGRSSS